ncbi:hypothetical protein D4764_0184810%2C partial [Scomber scombrus]|uniref:Uncharacterized protein n=1 Tax=Scomber scombrus TaxID=13677 RepID=A0AAV1P8K2_SCOSC
MKSTGMRSVVVRFIVIPYVCLQLCSAQDLTCNVTQVGGLTVYNITDGSHVSADCHYSWTNSNDVLAHPKDENGLVVRNEVSTLVTSECFNEIFNTQTCKPEETELTAGCIVNCSKIKVNEDKVKLEKQAMSPSMTAAVVIVPLLLVLVGIVLVLLIWHYREQIKGWCYSGSYSTTSSEEDV